MTSQIQIHRIPAQHNGFKGFFAHILFALAARRQRRALKQLGDEALNDIGITRAQALAESRRPVWDAPHHWLR